MEESGHLKLLDAIVSLWYQHRIAIIAIGVAVFVGLRIGVVGRPLRKRLASSPEGGSTPTKPTFPVNNHLGDSGDVKEISVPTAFSIPAKAVTIREESETGGTTASIKTSRSVPKRFKGSRPRRVEKSSSEVRKAELSKIQPLIFFSSLTATTEARAKELFEDISSFVADEPASFLAPQLHDLSYLDYDDFFTSPPKVTAVPVRTSFFYLIVLPTYNIDTILNNFLTHLQETHHDFRIDTAPLSALAGYSVFGFGDKEGWPTEDEGFCSQAKEVDMWMAKLTGRKRAFPLGMGDTKSDANERLEEWRHGVEQVMRSIAEEGGLGEGLPGSGDAVESDEEDLDKPNAKKSDSRQGADVQDLEDLKGLSVPLPIDYTASSTPPSTALSINPKPLPPMVPLSSPTYASLTKQGYSILGTHSGVKLCRWTKSALRGRGSCYKYTFYGIASHLCMETTPSLSCSNKCVFCWRHGTNPVSTTWRWQVDPPDLIFEGAKKEHLRRIKMLRGVPGVRAERFQEAMRIRHCALSLVGEPIFYPHINALLGMMHQERISTFLVCNAQHPQQLAALENCTQLYVSIDASNRESLRKIDRPLHRDFWERFLACLDILRERRRRMRTVYRLTLVKGFNVEEEVEGYASLVERGLPCFVEVKGVTYCGTSSSTAAGLTMQNVPFYEEVRDFTVALVEALGRRGLGRYGVAAEHKHSCCLLIGDGDRIKDKTSGRWRTRIDFQRYFELLEGHRGEDWGVEDYLGDETPEWAQLGKGGFDPRDERVDRKGRRVVEDVN